jgi:hypothetical protein
MQFGGRTVAAAVGPVFEDDPELGEGPALGEGLALGEGPAEALPDGFAEGAAVPGVALRDVAPGDAVTVVPAVAPAVGEGDGQTAARPVNLLTMSRASASESAEIPDETCSVG